MEIYNSFYKLKDTNIDDSNENANYIYLSQDRYEGRGEKFFYRIPIDDTDLLFNKHLNSDYHLYEIIPEGVKVKPYFDLEIEEQDAHVNSMQRVSMFIDFALPIMNELYNVNITKDDIIYLNSTRDNKLSYHIVIHNYMFNNNAEQKTFIKYLKSKFDALKNSDPVKTALSWMYKGSEQRVIFDCIPYNKNQNIRLVNQSKKGKPYVLKKTSELVSNKRTITRVLPTDKFTLLTTSEDLCVAPVKRPSQKKTVSKASKKQKTSVMTATEQADYETLLKYTLYYNDKMTVKSIKEEELYYQYLAIIPNYNIDWETYRNVGFALKGCGADITIYKKWARLSEKYDEHDPIFKDYIKFRAKNDVCRYDERYLRGLAKNTNMELHQQIFDTKMDKINEYLMCDYTDFIVSMRNQSIFVRMIQQVSLNIMMIWNLKKVHSHKDEILEAMNEH